MGDGEKKDQWMTAKVNDTSHSLDSLVSRLRMGDIAALTENFIVSKALIAFAQSNVIEKVRWVEDEKTLSI